LESSLFLSVGTMYLGSIQSVIHRSQSSDRASFIGERQSWIKGLEGDRIQDFDSGAIESARIADSVLDVTSRDALMRHAPESAAGHGFLVGPHIIDGQIRPTQLGLQKSLGMILSAVQRSEYFHLVPNLTFQRIPPGIAVKVQTKTGASRRRSQIQGDHGIAIPHPKRAG